MDWMNSYSGPDSKSVSYTSELVDPSGAVYYDPTGAVNGRRIRGGRSSNPLMPSGLRRCSDYRRESMVGLNIQPTIRRTSNGSLSTIYPHFLPYTDSFAFGTPYEGWLNLDNAAITECLLKMASAKVQLVNDLIEARQTFNLLCDTWQAACRSLINLRRGQYGAIIRDMRGVGSLPKRAANKWLEWVYGWKPLASELYNIQEVVKSKHSDTKVIRAVREKKARNGFLAAGDSGPYWDDLQDPAILDYSSKCILYATLGNTYTQMAKEWGCYNPISIAWEAVPYSFVIDWVLPVGNVIEAWTASDGCKFLTGCITRRVSGKFRPSWLSYSGIGGQWNSGSVIQRSSATFEYSSMVRSSLSDFPMPLPYFKNPFSTSHAASALALASQLR